MGLIFLASVTAFYTGFRRIIKQDDHYVHCALVHLCWQAFYLSTTILLIYAATSVTREVSYTFWTIWTDHFLESFMNRACLCTFEFVWIRDIKKSTLFSFGLGSKCITNPTWHLQFVRQYRCNSYGKKLWNPKQISILYTSVVHWFVHFSLNVK